MSATCPNCKSSVAASAASCPNCKADFGKHSAWRPVVAGNQTDSPAEFAFPLALGSSLLAIAAWAFVVFTSITASRAQTGDLQMFRWALSRSLAGFGPNLGLMAVGLGLAAVFLSRRRQVPWMGLILGSGLWLFAQIGSHPSLQ